jgi:HSP20 family molecular chaperone IbpA
MWAEACEVLDRAERLHRKFFALGRGTARAPAWEPPIDMFETEQQLWVLIALPGVDPAQVDVVIDSGVLIVSGDRGLPVELRHAAIHRLEIPHGRFERRIALPAGRFEFAGHAASHGCLLLGLTKRE